MSLKYLSIHYFLLLTIMYIYLIHICNVCVKVCQKKIKNLTSKKFWSKWSLIESIPGRLPAQRRGDLLELKIFVGKIIYHSMYTFVKIKSFTKVA
jgi:hypothetical protein